MTFAERRSAVNAVVHSNSKDTGWRGRCHRGVCLDQLEADEFRLAGAGAGDCKHCFRLGWGT